METNQGDVICPDCNGSGNQATFEKIPDYGVVFMCDTCQGTGKFDWLEAITMKKKCQSIIHNNKEILYYE